MVAIRVLAPGVNVMRLAITSSITLAGSPLSRLTRSRSAGVNSISPRMARSVMAATRAFCPTRSASSSMHSWPIMVESMSATISRLRRRTAACTTTSMALAAMAPRTRSATTRLSFPASSVKTMSAAIPGSSHCARSGDGSTARARASIASSSADVGEIRVATELMPDRTRAVLIAGPTASGKSALALAIAEELDGMIINADSMQIYSDLRVITARPTAAEEAKIPHRLYGYVDAAMHYSVGHYLTDARDVLTRAERQGKVPILVGGTGLYFKALTHGLAQIPPIPAAVRITVRQRLATEGPEALHAELARHDPAAAERLKPADRQRISRALEVVLATGRPLADWHHREVAPLLDPARVVRSFIAPPREELYARIDARFDLMLKAGALDEVRRLAARRLDPSLPVMKAHGVPALIQHLGGKLTLAQASDRAKRDVRHYAKRQFTWFRHQLADWTLVAPENAGDQILRAVVR